MKNVFCIITVMLLMFSSCNKVEDEGMYKISDKKVKSMNTSDLVDNLLDRPLGKYHMAPSCLVCSSLEFQGVTEFNKALKLDKVATELFKRDDCFSVLTKKYQTLIEEMNAFSDHNRLGYFEMVLASDMCMSALNDQEKIQLLVLALEREETEIDKYLVSTVCHIMVSIMISCDYTPFVEDMVPLLHETLGGYTFDVPGSDLLYIGFGEYHAEIIVNYARQFLNSLKPILQ